MFTPRTAVMAALIGSSLALTAGGSLVTAQQHATPTPFSCTDLAQLAASPSPALSMHDMAEQTATPSNGMDHTMADLDLMYIDMMIPHHASIMAMAEAALPRLTDERLQEMATEIVAVQGPEIAELQRFREEFFGDPAPMPMDDAMMMAMDQLMPGMSGTMEEMAFQMDTAAQVSAICAAENADLAFIEQTIPHHQMAIEASEAVLAGSGRPEIRDIAERVISAQQLEIDALNAIRDELAPAATPQNS